ncbi:polygalacturonase [Lactuca sativa]|uniref:polygalacturonase n=1 Tax=Lactuca sativa TaxID=4236 RepID=UPI001C69043D|nr:polygalacturonase [Lactuca sativa]
MHTPLAPLLLVPPADMANKRFLTAACIYLILSFFQSSCDAASYNVVRFGARSNGRTDSSQAFQNAWKAACAASGSSNMVYIPRGTFMTKPVVFSGPCRSRILFQNDGTIVAPPNYQDMGNSGFWILFTKLSRLTVQGGTIDARGTQFWACRRTGSRCPAGVRSITFMWSNNVLVRGVTSLYSQTIHVAVSRCTNIVFDRMRIVAPSRSPNTDGIIVQSSTGVTIKNSLIKTGDDCIAIGPGSKNVWIQKIACGPGHGISIGSLGNSLNEAGVQNVTVTDSIFTKTQNGVRIKSWARDSKSYATNVEFRNIIMRAVDNPIFIDQTYCPSNRCPRETSGVQVSNVRYSNIKGTSTTVEAVKFECSASNPCRGIRMRNIRITTPNRPTISTCEHVAGSSSGVIIPKSCL